MEQDIPDPRHKTPNPDWTVSSWSKNCFPLGHSVGIAAPGSILALASGAKHDFPLSRCLNNTGL